MNPPSPDTIRELTRIFRHRMRKSRAAFYKASAATSMLQRQHLSELGQDWKRQADRLKKDIEDFLLL